MAADPDDFVAQNRLAALCLQWARESGELHWLDRAEKAVAASLRAFPEDSNPEASLLQGSCDLAFHRFKAAKATGLRLTEAQHPKPGAYLLLGDATFELGELDRAEAAWNEAGRLLEGNFSVLGRQSRLALFRGQFEQARKLLDDAIVMASERLFTSPEPLTWLMVQRGAVEFKSGEWAAAEGFYQAALKLEPAYWSARDHLAELRASQGRWDEALELVENVAESIGRPELFQAAGDIAAAAGRDTLAQKWMDRAERAYLGAIEKGDERWLHHLAGFYSDSREKPEEAVRWARRDLGQRSTAASHDALAWALFKAGDVAGANESATHALAWEAADPHLLYHAGLIRIAGHQIAEGRALLARAAAVNPHGQAFHFHR
ncbi:MAG: hypothetical protein JWL59_4297 [Chthoniobacteraceae bacterium]|nr:hypothetical protein [Chthoniobacteraceae bacterium]